MTEYRKVVDIKCALKNGAWDCDISRILTDEPKEIQGNLCFIKKTETEKGLVDVHLEDDAEKCVVIDTGKGNSMRCSK